MPEKTYQDRGLLRSKVDALKQRDTLEDRQKRNIRDGTRLSSRRAFSGWMYLEHVAADSLNIIHLSLQERHPFGLRDRSIDWSYSLRSISSLK